MKRLTLLSLFLACNATAGIEYSDIFVRSSYAFPSSPTAHYGTLPFADPTKLEVFSNIPTWGKFTLDSTNQHSDAFASAFGTGNGEMGAGVTGMRFAANPDYEIPMAVVNFTFTVFNTGNAPAPLAFNYKIPQMELWVTQFGEFSHAYTEVRLETSQYLDNGDLLVSDTPLSYWAHLSKKRAEVSDLKESSQLAAFTHGGATTDQYDKVTYPIIEGWAPLGILLPGETMDFDYRLLVYTYSSTEAGGQAFVGDPFSVTTGQSFFEVIVAPNSDVPEPATAALVLAALALCKTINRRIK
ncbi:MAG: hypothetical protein JST93_21105 [Acidobacteria bacterium]|nr:hypothetical protein [Acidobacteriota bacterium]